MRINHVLIELKVLFYLKEVEEVVKMMESGMIGISLEQDRETKLKKLSVKSAIKKMYIQMLT